MRDPVPHEAMPKILIDKPGEWIERAGPEPETVLSTHGSLARNLADLPFTSRCSDDERRAVEERALQAFENAGLLSTGSYIPLTELHAREVRMLIERHLITRQLLEGRGPRGAYIAHDQSLSVMVNERDHLRIAAIASGLQPDEVWARLNQLDDQLGESLEFAFHERRGYLTSSLDEVGTALKLAAVLHLPGLNATKQILAVEKTARQEHHVLTGMFNGVSEAPGDLFTLSNRGTLGRSEGEIAFHLRTLALAIVAKEKSARETLLGDGVRSVADRVGRALGIARGARLLEFKEALSLLSSLRLGVATGQLDAYSYRDLDEVLVTSQPAHLECKSGGALDELMQSIARADLFRNRFS